MKLFKNKKGLDYMFLLVVAVLICLTALYLQLAKKLSDRECLGDKACTVGGKAIALLKAEQKAQEVLFYADYSGKYSAFKSVYELAERGGFGFRMQACGLHGRYAIWNYKDAPEKLCIPNVYDNLAKIMNDNLNSYVDTYFNYKDKLTNLPGNNYEFLIKEDGIAGIAIEDASIQIEIESPTGEIWYLIQIGKDVSGFTGRYYFKPSFRVDFRTGIRDYREIANVAKAIVGDCAGKGNNTDGCVKSKIVETASLSWQVKKDGDTYLFDIAQKTVKPVTFSTNPVIQMGIYVPNAEIPESSA